MAKPLLLSLCLVLALASCYASAKHFYESFEETWEGRWIPSKHEEYSGIWKHSKSEGHENSGLLVSEKARKYGLAIGLDEKVNFLDKPVVLQYDVRLLNGLECGGAYLKFLQPQESGWTPGQFSNESPYSIMFGPDKCGSTNKVHFIFRHKHPKTEKYIEHHLKHPPTPINDKLSHVYTAIIFPNNTVNILIDGEVKKTADLLSKDFEPPVLPPKVIPDPDDKKPEDWDEREKIPDSEATKPEDWDEDAPLEIEDMEAEKPEGWLDDEPEEVDDPESVKPEDWEDEEDGEWEPPKVPNPKCVEGPGCGTWVRPKKRNPAFKGKWYAPMIENPNYKGKWKPREIPNPDYFELEKPNLEPVAAIGIEIWTMQDGIFFDNILVTKDEAAALEFRQNTWKVKYEIEKALEPKVEAAKTELSGFQGQVFGYLRHVAGMSFLKAYSEKLNTWIEKGEEKPILTISLLAAIPLIFLVLLYKLLFGAKKVDPKVVSVEKSKKEDITAEDDANTESKEERKGELVQGEEGAKAPRRRKAPRDN